MCGTASSKEYTEDEMFANYKRDQRFNSNDQQSKAFKVHAATPVANQNSNVKVQNKQVDMTNGKNYVPGLLKVVGKVDHAQTNTDA